jgi:hypothetical protein
MSPVPRFWQRRLGESEDLSTLFSRSRRQVRLRRAVPQRRGLRRPAQRRHKQFHQWLDLRRRHAVNGTSPALNSILVLWIDSIGVLQGPNGSSCRWATTRRGRRYSAAAAEAPMRSLACGITRMTSLLFYFVDRSDKSLAFVLKGPRRPDKFRAIRVLPDFDPEDIGRVFHQDQRVLSVGGDGTSGVWTSAGRVGVLSRAFHVALLRKRCRLTDAAPSRAISVELPLHYPMPRLPAQSLGGVSGQVAGGVGA